jgi:hypothetical protein
MKITVATFGSEGEPHDRGMNITPCFEKFKQACLNSGIDEVHCYTPRTLHDILDPNVATNATRCYPEKNKIVCDQYHKVGLGAWRAEILNYEVNKADDGDIVMFHDPHYLKYPGILTFAQQARDYALNASLISKESGIFSPPHSTLRSNISFEGLSFISSLPGGGKIPDLKSLQDWPVCKCRCIVITVSEKTRAFCKNFAETCKLEKALIPLDSSDPNGGWKGPGAKFYHHAGEQAVFNALALTHGYLKVHGSDSWFFDMKNAAPNSDTGALMLSNYAARKKLQFCKH